MGQWQGPRWGRAAEPGSSHPAPVGSCRGFVPRDRMGKLRQMTRPPSSRAELSWWRMHPLGCRQLDPATKPTASSSSIDREMEPDGGSGSLSPAGQRGFAPGLFPWREGVGRSPRPGQPRAWLPRGREGG